MQLNRWKCWKAWRGNDAPANDAPAQAAPRAPGAPGNQIPQERLLSQTEVIRRRGLQHYEYKIIDRPEELAAIHNLDLLLSPIFVLPISNVTPHRDQAQLIKEKWETLMASGYHSQLTSTPIYKERSVERLENGNLIVLNQTNEPDCDLASFIRDALVNELRNKNIFDLLNNKEYVNDLEPLVAVEALQGTGELGEQVREVAQQAPVEAIPPNPNSAGNLSNVSGYAGTFGRVTVRERDEKYGRGRDGDNVEAGRPQTGDLNEDEGHHDNIAAENNNQVENRDLPQDGRAANDNANNNDDDDGRENNNGMENNVEHDESKRKYLRYLSFQIILQPYWSWRSNQEQQWELITGQVIRATIIEIVSHDEQMKFYILKLDSDDIPSLFNYNKILVQPANGTEVAVQAKPTGWWDKLKSYWPKSQTASVPQCHQMNYFINEIDQVFNRNKLFWPTSKRDYQDADISIVASDLINMIFNEGTKKSFQNFISAQLIDPGIHLTEFQQYCSTMIEDMESKTMLGSNVMNYLKITNQSFKTELNQLVADIKDIQNLNTSTEARFESVFNINPVIIIPICQIIFNILEIFGYPVVEKAVMVVLNSYVGLFIDKLKDDSNTSKISSLLDSPEKQVISLLDIIRHSWENFSKDEKAYDLVKEFLEYSVTNPVRAGNIVLSVFLGIGLFLSILLNGWNWLRRPKERKKQALIRRTSNRYSFDHNT